MRPKYTVKVGFENIKMIQWPEVMLIHFQVIIIVMHTLAYTVIMLAGMLATVDSYIIMLSTYVIRDIV